MTATAPLSAHARESLPSDETSGLDAALVLLELTAVGTPELIRAAHTRKDASLAEPSGARWPAALRERAARQRERLAQARDRLLECAEQQRVAAPVRADSAGATGRDAAANSGTPAASEDQLIGTILARRYEILEFIGEGGMGRVFRAFDRIKQVYVAVKVISPELVRQKGAQERFVTEAKLACSLSHPNIIRVHDVCADDEGHFITMELLHGQTLRARLDQQKRSRRPFPLDQGMTLARELLGGLAFAHQHLVHRDIKPENIWVCEDGTAKLMDFGVAQALNGERRSRTLQSVGSAYYVAPEHLRGLALDHRGDQYSLAVVLYELFSGHLPTGVTRGLGEERSELPAGAAAAVMKALRPSPEERFASTDDFRRAFDHTPWLAAVLPRSAAVRRALGVGVAVALLACGLGAASVALQGRSLERLHLFQTSADRDGAIEAQATVAQLLVRADAVAAERQATLNTLRDRSAHGTSARGSAAGGDPAADDSQSARGELDLWTGLLFPSSAQIAMHSKRASADAALKEGRISEANDAYEQIRAWVAPRVAAIPRLPYLARARAAALVATGAPVLGDAASSPEQQASSAAAATRAQALFRSGDASVAEAKTDEAIAAYRDAVALYEIAHQVERARLAGMAQAAVAQARAQGAGAAAVRIAHEAAQQAVHRREADRRAEIVRGGRQFHDHLSSGGEGPLMVVEDGGSAEAGEGVARSRSEIDPSDLARFFKARGRPSRMQEAATLYRDPSAVGEGNVVAAADAREYAEWLGIETGQRYRVARMVRRGDLGVTFFVSRALAP